MDEDRGIARRHRVEQKEWKEALYQWNGTNVQLVLEKEQEQAQVAGYQETLLWLSYKTYSASLLNKI